MKSSWRCGAVLAVGMFIAGCGMQPGTTMAKYSKGSGTIMTVAPSDAMYALYSSDDTTAIVKFPVKSGDKLGFTENADGTATAVAGTHTQDIKTSMMSHTFYWKEQK